jgi:hypothetical protein
MAAILDVSIPRIVGIEQWLTSPELCGIPPISCLNQLTRSQSKKEDDL